MPEPLRTVSYIHKQEDKTLRKAHPELKDVLKCINLLVKEKRLRSAMDGNEESHYKEVNEQLNKKVLKPFTDFSKPDQQKLVGNHIVHSG